MMRYATLLTMIAFAAAGSSVLSNQADVFTELGSNEVEAREQIFGAFATEGFVPHGTAAAFKTATTEVRVAMVTAVVAFARGYTATPDFSRRYAQYRESQKPDAPEPARTAAQVNDETRRQMEEAIANARKMAKEMPAMKQEFDKMVSELQKQLAELGKDPAMTAQMDDAFKQQADLEAKQYQEALAEWETEYPADPQKLIAARLKAFLDLSATVDYAAPTAPGNDKKLRFVDARLEAKNRQWKMMYRAGQPAVDAARAAAEEWLASASPVR